MTPDQEIQTTAAKQPIERLRAEPIIKKPCEPEWTQATGQVPEPMPDGLWNHEENEG